MNDSLTTLTLVGSEIGAVLIVFFIFIAVIFVKKRRANKGRVKAFIEDYKNALPEKRAKMKNSLESDCSIVGDDCESLLNTLANSEKKLYKHLLNMYMGYERDSLQDIERGVNNLSELWVGTMMESIRKAAENSTVGKEEIARLETELETLKGENERIAIEFSGAMTTMEEILKEYSLMYAGQENEKMDGLSDDYEKIKKKSDGHLEPKE